MNTNRKHIFDEIEAIRTDQEAEYGESNQDSPNSVKDWVAMITKQAGLSLVRPVVPQSFRTRMLHVAALAVAAVEAVDSN